MITFKQFITESLRRPEGLRDMLNQMDLLDVHTSSVGLTKILSKYGWSVIGSGSYGIVYGHPNYNWCIKVFSDMGYTEWIKFSKRNASNPYVPQFKGEVITTGSGVSFIRVEKLVPASKSQFKDLQDIIASFYTVRGTIKAHNDLFQLQKAFAIVNKTGRYNDQDITMDLNPTNVMVRPSTKHIVVTDPWVG